MHAASAIRFNPGRFLSCENIAYVTSVAARHIMESVVRTNERYASTMSDIRKGGTQMHVSTPVWEMEVRANF